MRATWSNANEEDGGGTAARVPAERTSGLPSGAEAASNPECREEGRGGWGLKPLCEGGHDGPASDNESGQTETQRQCINQTS